MKTKFKKGEIASLFGDYVEILDNEHESGFLIIKHIDGGEIDTATEQSLKKTRPLAYWRGVFNKGFEAGQASSGHPIAFRDLFMMHKNPITDFILRESFTLGIKNVNANKITIDQLFHKIMKRVLKNLNSVTNK